VNAISLSGKTKACAFYRRLPLLIACGMIAATEFLRPHIKGGRLLGRFD
jgi:hypothetical protein